MINYGALVKMLIEHESLRLKPYRCTSGKLTIGVGRNIEDRGISRNEAMMLLHNDIDDVARELEKALPFWSQLDDVRQLALADMAFNCGIGGLLKFKRMLAALEAKDFRIAADEALRSKWAGQVKGRANRIAQMIRHGKENS